jgi:hypothetical protein
MLLNSQWLIKWVKRCESEKLLEIFKYKPQHNTIIFSDLKRIFEFFSKIFWKYSN